VAIEAQIAARATVLVNSFFEKYIILSLYIVLK
jgi:hypothetical protein